MSWQNRRLHLLGVFVILMEEILMKQLINFSRTSIIKEINVQSNLYYGRFYYCFESGRHAPLENSEALNGTCTENKIAREESLDGN